ncbi:hypothetical protein SPI_08106 [Niveomyces insectorum RCEF 264]|uniref:Uncharacterized protein n=1 Tax=Niveomyces insectorum RCEF 264 TaxID=1081102 RepID=A0A167NTH6_9HYPO|nr:hypothetical protein SPI_08106 [Niveomyces insectorum RCEF 264]
MGHVQNWAEVQFQGLAVVEETLRLARRRREQREARREVRRAGEREGAEGVVDGAARGEDDDGSSSGSDSGSYTGSSRSGSRSRSRSRSRSPSGRLSRSHSGPRHPVAENVGEASPGPERACSAHGDANDKGKGAATAEGDDATACPPDNETVQANETTKTETVEDGPAQAAGPLGKGEATSEAAGEVVILAEAAKKRDKGKGKVPPVAGEDAPADKTSAPEGSSAVGGPAIAATEARNELAQTEAAAETGVEAEAGEAKEVPGKEEQVNREPVKESRNGEKATLVDAKEENAVEERTNDKATTVGQAEGADTKGMPSKGTETDEETAAVTGDGGGQAETNAEEGGAARDTPEARNDDGPTGQ